MTQKYFQRLLGVFSAGCLILGASHASAAVTNIFLRAGTVTNTMPDGRPVVMWGFARETSATGNSGTVTVPGPAIKLPDGVWDVSITVTNELPEAVSIVIPNQTGIMGDPKRNNDGRIRSFTHEAAPGNVATYTFMNVNPGTYLYQSGSHQAVQLQMGLYGEMTKMAGANTAYANAVTNVAEATFLFHEIDPYIHDAIATDNYGPGKIVTSAVDYHPAYFFINGHSYVAGDETNWLSHIKISSASGQVLIRMINASISYHSPVFGNLPLSIRAEDGNLYPNAKIRSAAMLSPLKTMDAYWTFTNRRTVPMFDRGSGTSAGTNSSGGMIAYLDVASASNTVPTFTAIPNSTNNELTLITKQFVAADVDYPPQTLTFSLINPVAGATVTPNGLFTWTPSEAQGPSSNYFRAVVTDNGSPNYSVTNAFFIRVLEVNNPPIFNAPIVSQTIDELVPFTYTDTATDPNLVNGVGTNTVRYLMLAGSPVGSTFNTNTGLFAWTPTEAQGPSTNLVRIVAYNNGIPAAYVTNAFTLTVREVNLAPVLAPIPNRQLAFGQSVAFNTVASDADVPANTLTYSLIGAPAGAAISPTGAFTWTPTVGQVGSSNFITVTVTDNGVPSLSASQSFVVLVVEPNVPPIIPAIADQSVDEGSTLNVTFTATDSNVPAQVLSFSLGAGAPAGASVTSGGLFTWTPSEAQGPSTNLITVIVRDNGSPILSATNTVRVVVNEVNQAPTIQPIANQIAYAGQTLTVPVLAGDADIVPGNALSYSLGAGAPAGAAISVTGIFTWTPASTDLFLTNTVSVIVTDNGVPSLSATQQFSIYVTLPTQTFASGNVIIPIQGNANPYPITLNVAGSLPYVHKVTLTLSNLYSRRPQDLQVLLVAPTGKSVLMMSDCGATTTAAQTTNVTITFDAAALALLPATQLSSGSFRPTDYPPVTTFPAPAPASGWTTNLNSFLGDSANGTWSVYIFDRAANGAVNSTIQSVALNITTRQVSFYPPVIQPVLNQTVNELSPLGFAVVATDGNGVGTPITLALGAGAPAGVTLNSASGLFAWTPSEAQGPSTNVISVIATVTTNATLSATNTFTVVVNEVNQTPTVQPIANRTASKGNLVSFAVTATDADLPANILSYGLVGAPAGATIDAAGNFTWTPSVGQLGTSNYITVTVADDGVPAASASQSFVIFVVEPNVAPTINPIADQTVNEGSPLNVTVTAADINVPVQSLTFSLGAGAPVGASIAANGNFTWTPSESQGPSTNVIAVVVTDDGSPTLTANATLTVVVNEVNQAPVIQPIANQTVLVGQTVTANVLANDADLPANSLNYSLDAGAPAGAAISGAGLFTWTPSSSGTNVISVIVSDNGDPSLTATNTFRVVANYFTQNYTNNSNISIPGSGSAGLYPSTIVASGSLGHIQKVVVTLVGFTHPRPADVDVLLVSPSGSSVLLMSDCGGSSLLTNAITLTLDDAAASNLTTATPVTGTFKPTDLVGVADTFVAPSPTSGWSPTLSSLNGTVADGTWRLYVRDNQTGPAGTGVTAQFTGYRLTITSVP